MACYNKTIKCNIGVHAMPIISYSKQDLFLEDSQSNAELSIFFGGKELSIVKDHRHGPYTHDYYDVNYIKHGNMTLTVNGQVIHIRENSLFVVPPYAVVEQKYTGENNSVLYVNVSGSIAERLFSELGFSEQSIVFPTPLPKQSVETFEKIISALPMYTNFSIHRENMKRISYVTATPKESRRENQLRRIGCFYQFMAELMQLYHAVHAQSVSEEAPNDYVTEAIKYIESQYRYALSVELVAQHLGITRNYLHALFRKDLGISVQEFIIQTRMRIACDLLKHQSIPINIVATSVGYEPVAFGHAFKKVTGISPRAYRERYNNQGNV